MKICKIIIKDYQQFQDFELDLTYPEGHEKAGEPLEKVCLIGSNGTGKSTLLGIIKRKIFTEKIYDVTINAIIKYKLNQKEIYNIHSFFYDASILEQEGHWEIIHDYIKGNPSNDKALYSKQLSILQKASVKDNDIKAKFGFHNNANDLLISVPADSSYYNASPYANVDSALKLFNNFSSHHTVSSDTLNDFWKLLIYQIKKRENNFLAFQKQEENLDKTVRSVQEEFDKKSPKILTEIAKLWDKILDKAGLEFDVEGASNPIQLNDNLQAYIRLKGTDKNIPYSQLSTGIRNFIFRVGHIFTLYFNRNIERGFLLLDEPENSLHPDFLYDLVDIYTGIIQNTQFFVATHNPIIAAQFEPYERFILEFDEQGVVHAKRGTTPIGDDPNDLLMQDFGVRNLLGKEGIKKWERYVELKSLIQREENKTNKVQLLEEFLSIGQAYNFPLQ